MYFLFQKKVKVKKYTFYIQIPWKFRKIHNTVQIILFKYNVLVQTIIFNKKHKKLQTIKLKTLVRKIEQLIYLFFY